MNPRLVGLASIYRTNTRIFHMTLMDLDDQQVRQQPVEGRNCPLWIAGHAVGSRALVARLAGTSYDFPPGELFARDAVVEPADLPPLDEVVRHWDAVSERLDARFEQLGDPELDAEVQQDFPGGDRSLLNALAFLALHESYHLGQIGFLRTALGYTGIAESRR